MDAFNFEVVATRVRVDCPDRAIVDLLHTTYGHLATDDGNRANLRYSITEVDSGVYRVESHSDPNDDFPQDRSRSIAGRGGLLALLDDYLVVSLQLAHPELYFLHAAVVSWKGSGFVLPATTGSGKSTFAWALLSHGFEYVSDELAPLSLDPPSVVPFPRALCLKQEPPPDYKISTAALTTERSIHIPPTALPLYNEPGSLPVAAIIFPKYRSEGQDPSPRRISPGRAATRIYENCLNALSHSGLGLDAATSLATQLPCYEISTTELRAACGSVHHLAEELVDEL